MKLSERDEFLIHLSFLMGIPPNELETRLSAIWLLKMQFYVARYGWPEDYSELMAARLLHTIQTFLGAKNLDFTSMLPPRMQKNIKSSEEAEEFRKEQLRRNTIEALKYLKRVAEAPSKEEKKAARRAKREAKVKEK